MFDSEIVSLRASDAGKWAGCAKRAAHEAALGPREEPLAATHVGAELGSRVHRLIAGEGPAPEVPGTAIIYDADTPTHKELQRQSRETAGIAADMLRDRKMTPASPKPGEMSAVVSSGRLKRRKIRVVGRPDMLAEDKDGNLWLVDLKTGRYPPTAAWLQIAVYCWLYRTLRRGKIEGGAVLWVQRHMKKQRHLAARIFDVRPLEEMVRLGEQVVRRTAQVLSTDDPLPTPSLAGCSSCPLSEKCPAVLAVVRETE